MKSLQILRFSAALFVLLSGICRADTIGVSLTSTVLSGSPGSALTFSGILANLTGSTVFLNSAGINLVGPFTPADQDTSPFFANAPLFLTGNGSTPVIDLFTINIPNPFAAGTYIGTFTVLGGADGDAQDVVGSVNFAVQAVPEPAVDSLLIAALLMLLVFQVVRRRKLRLRQDAA